MRNKNIKTLQYLVEELNFNYFQFQNKSFDYFCDASLNENLEIIKYLVNLKFNVYCVNEIGKNILTIFESAFVIFDTEYYLKSDYEIINFPILKEMEIYTYLLEDVRIEKTCDVIGGDNNYYKFYFVYTYYNDSSEFQITKKYLNLMIKLSFLNDIGLSEYERNKIIDHRMTYLTRKI